MFELVHYLIISLGVNLAMFIPGYVFRTDKLTDLSYALTFMILALTSFMLGGVSSPKLILLVMIVIWGLAYISIAKKFHSLHLHFGHLNALCY